MKKIKFMIAVLLFLLCFLLNSELYQNYSSSFHNQFYYFEVNEEENSMELYEALEGAVKQEKQGVFTIVQKMESPKNVIYYILANKQAEKILQEYGIQEGTYKSLFSGITRIQMLPLKELEHYESAERFYFTGTMEEVLTVKGILNRDYATSYVHREDKSGLEYMIFGIWGIAGLFFLLLTWFDIQFQKKEYFLLVSLGTSRAKIVWKNIITDSVYCGALFAGYYALLEKKIYIAYGMNVIIWIFAGMLVLNAILYSSMLLYSYKQIMYGAGMDETTLAGCYILKVFTMMLALLSLSINFGLLAENIKYIRLYPLIGNYQEYGFLDIEIEDKTPDEIEVIWNEVLKECYEMDKTALAVSKFSGDEGNYVILNQKTKGNVDGIELEKDLGYDVVCYLPYGLDSEAQVIEDAILSTALCLGIDEEKISYQVERYKKSASVLYFNSRVDSPFIAGFGQIENPVMIYCQFDTKRFKELGTGEGFSADNIKEDVMVRLTARDLQNLKEKYHLDDISLVGVVERCDRYKATLIRILLLNTIISCFMLVLEMLFISMINKMEYMIHARELAIKKIFGYSILQKNKQMLWLSAFAAGIAILTMVLIAVMFNLYGIVECLLIGIGITVMEYAFMFINIVKLERKSITKILKGGIL